MKNVHDIIKNGLCLGCGLCEAIAGRENCEMKISEEGFYRPVFKSALTKENNKKIVECCPGIHVEGDKHSGVWGNTLSVTESWSSNAMLRKKSATGGVISSLAIFLLETKRVDAILQVGVRKDSWLYNELLISKTKEDVVRNAQSRYAPALVFDKIKQILDETGDTFCFIGKPCDIAGLKNFLKINPQYAKRVKYTLAIFCAGIPSYNATKKLVSQANLKEEPIFLKYRGDGWPGEFEARWHTGQSIKISYNDSWGKVLGRTLSIRCKICPDGIGMLADISTGDSWNTKNGYPDFTEAEGRNFCFVRTKGGSEIYDEATRSGYITSRKLDVALIQDMHRYQYTRRILAGWRIAAIQFLTKGVLNFRGLGLLNLMPKLNILKGLKEFVGALKRALV